MRDGYIAIDVPPRTPRAPKCLNSHVHSRRQQSIMWRLAPVADRLARLHRRGAHGESQPGPRAARSAPLQGSCGLEMVCISRSPARLPRVTSGLRHIFRLRRRVVVPQLPRSECATAVTARRFKGCWAVGIHHSVKG
ncbi:uncharacterized protein CC84DRAFT_476135 [Paraphaeosphaeria sporulosa]|uniref:Uncharacterized protein n=1 Tax=Paraphaeosphaeria sporulosa TaxID=1460663 RepID=A0A177CU28_9PLEO|nr:uncharacterized protein CC84DRAFT_476135 [Paraphaeosphaeria sporulosa]OAG10269.1 hypothetical protein CC84DRAFT_476135 [Paraphaeosphaeria sporulosa]